MEVFSHSLVLESEVNKRTETCSVEGSEAEYEQKHTDGPCREMLPFGKIRIEHPVLQLFPKGEQNDEREY
jgi:hypothetical protein